MAGMAAPLMPTDLVSRAFWGLNDSGNARRFIAQHGDRFLYVRAQGWLAYDGKHWALDGAEAAALRAAVQVSRRRHANLTTPQIDSPTSLTRLPTRMQSPLGY